MGRLIDIDVLFDYFGNDAIDETTRSNIEYFISEKGTVEAIPKADYENRLKADMVAMLEDLDLKIDEMYEPQFSKEGMDGFYWAQGLFKALVQEKIKSLKGDTE